MTDDKTVDVFCYDCNVRVEARIVASHSESEPQGHPSYVNVIDVPWDIVEYNLAVCNRCKNVFLVKSTYIEIPGEVVAPQGEEVLYPTDRRITLDDVPKNVKLSYLEAALTFKTGAYSGCLAMCRKCLEAVCTGLGETKGSLYHRLDNLRKQDKISDKIFSWANEVRAVGNEAVHETEVIVNKTVAKDALEFVEAILLHVFSLEKRFEEFKKRHIKS